MNIGKRIKELRIKKGLNQTELGEMMELKCSAISAIESGKSDINSETIIKLCQFFNVSSEYLLTGKDLYTEIINQEEQEVIEMYRKDNQLKEAFEMIKTGKKKAIERLRNYQPSNLQNA